MSDRFARYAFQNPSPFDMASVIYTEFGEGQNPFADHFDIRTMFSTMPGIFHGKVDPEPRVKRGFNGDFNAWHVWYVRYLVKQGDQTLVCFSDSMYFLTREEAESVSMKIRQEQEPGVIDPGTFMRQYRNPPTQA
jgi:hypothetical protein